MRVLRPAVLRASLRFMTKERLRVYPAVFLAVMSIAILVNAVMDPTSLGADFRAFYTAGTFVRTGRTDLLYDVGAAAQFQHEVLGARGVSAWLSPPYVAWPFAALSRLPFYGALLVHGAIGIAMGAAALTVLARELGTLRLSDMAWASACYYPTLQWLVNGQTSSLWTLIVVAVFVFLRRGRDTWAGIALGCLALKPQLAMGLVFALLGARRFRVLLAFVLTVGAWVGVGYLTLPSGMDDYVSKFGEIGTFLRSDGYPLAGLHGLFQVGPLALDAFSPRVATAAGAFITALACAALIAMWARARWQPGDAFWDRHMAATLALSTIASPHLFGYDLVLLLVPLFIVWRQFPEGTEGRPLDGGPLLIVTALLWVLALVGPALTVGQQLLTGLALQRSIALQLEVPVMLTWIWIVARPDTAA